MAPVGNPLPFGEYELLRRIGAGGMGEIFLARKHGAPPGNVVVVKKILPHLSEDRGFVGRFVDEGNVVVHLSHANIAQVVEMGEVEGQFFIAMEYVEGKTLAKVESRLREMNYSFPVDLALWLTAQVCEGLAYAHTRADPSGKPLQVVHRDISPSNIMLTYDGAVKIIDFGAALSTLKEELTAPRVVIGNLSYMAPEHARKLHVDHRADLFSVGVMLWELLTWQLIPADGDPIERWKRAARPSFPKPSSVRPDLSRDLDILVMKALATEPDARFADAEVFRGEILGALQRLGSAADTRKLGTFMRSVFQAELDAERAIVAEVMGTSGPVTSPTNAPFHTQSNPLLRSDETPSQLALDSTSPGQSALTVIGSPQMGRELSDPAARATIPGRPALDPEAIGLTETTAPRDRTHTLLDEPTGAMQEIPRAASARPMQRTPTQMRRGVPPYIWAALGVGLGFFVVGLLFALLH